MFLLFNMLCEFVRAFLPRSKSLLISWLQLLFSVKGCFPNLPANCERRQKPLKNKKATEEESVVLI